MKTLTVIVPIFNEARSIPQLVKEISELPKGVVSEVIFVNDGSSDNSVELLEGALSKTHLNYQVITKNNGGKASAIHAGVVGVHSTHSLILDADLELATTDILKLWDVVLSGRSETVFGYRSFLAQSSFTYRYAKGNHVISNLYGLLFNAVITDIMCGYKLVPTPMLQSLPFKFKKYAIEIEIPIHLWENKIRPFEVQVEYFPRSRAEGKGITVHDAVSIISSMIWYRIFKVHKK
ncbi:MAG: glycosyltransferase family 2 protein [Actinomycetes bacterium]